MKIRLNVQSSKLDEAVLSKFIGHLNRDLNEASGISAARATRKPEPGDRAFELLLDPQLWIEVGQSAAVSGLIGVLKAYLLRETSVSFDLRAPDGTELSVNAKNIDENKVLGLLKQMIMGTHDAVDRADDLVDMAPGTPEPVIPATTAPKTGTQGRKIALVIGIDSFDDPELDNLPFARNDAIALHNLLQGETGEQFDQVSLVTNGGHAEALRHIEELTTDLTRHDLFVVYYAGHGLVRNQKLHLAFQDTAVGLMHSTAMKYSSLLDIVEQATVAARLIILDCCYAGAAGEGATRSALSEQLNTELGASTRTLVLTSATSTQVAREKARYGHGVFTKHLLEGLRGAADRNGDGAVDTRELFDYIEEEMQSEPLQRPQKYNFSGIGAVTLRKTGMHPHRDLARDLRKQVNDLQHEGHLSLDQANQLNNLLGIELARMTSGERARFQLLQTHLAGDFKQGLFFDAWDQHMRGEKPAARPTQKPKRPEPSNDTQAARMGKAFAQFTTGTGQKLSSTVNRVRDRKPTPTKDESKKPDIDATVQISKKKWSGSTIFLRICTGIGMLVVLMFVLAFLANF